MVMVENGNSALSSLAIGIDENEQN